MLKIKNVSAEVDTQEILNDINLEFKAGEIHALIGPTKSGKSTFAHMIQGNPYIKLTAGDITFKNKSISKLPAHKRSRLGIFTSFQHPPEIEGLTHLEQIKALVKAKTNKEFTKDQEQVYRELVATLGLDSRYPDDPINTYSRHPEDCKRGEIVQMIMLQPDLVILDEIEIDLSAEAFEQIVSAVKAYIEDDNKTLIVITHSKELLTKLNPTFVHILVDGEVRASGAEELLKRIIEDGYPQFS